MHILTRTDSPRYIPPTECKILSIVPEVAVPQPCSTIFRIDLIGNDDLVSIKWTGEMPTKCKTRRNKFSSKNCLTKTETFHCRSRLVD